MSFWFVIFFFDLLIPVIMIFVGYWMWKHYPKEINPILGYRTQRSMKNLDTWKFAHIYIGRLWCKVGGILLIPSILVHLPFIQVDSDSIGLLSLVILSCQMVIMFIPIYFTEKALKENFDEEGNLFNK